MALVYITDSESKTELRFEVDGQDLMDDLLAQADAYDILEDGCENYWILPEADFDWWERWIEREERINAAYEDADEETRKEYERAVIDYGYDMEQMQYVLERILGIDNQEA